MSSNLERALGKTKKYRKNEYCGCFTPSEILALVEDGAKAVQSSIYKIERAKEAQKDGEGSRSWFYFTLGKHHPPIKETWKVIK